MGKKRGVTERTLPPASCPEKQTTGESSQGSNNSTLLAEKPAS